jgi:hypothetical protein
MVGCRRLYVSPALVHQGLSYTESQTKIVTWAGSREWGIGSRNIMFERNLVSDPNQIHKVKLMNM